MVMRALNHKLLREIKNLRTQSVTIAFLVMTGVSLLISAWSAYQSLSLAKEDYYERYHFADLFAEIKRAPQDIANKLAAVPGVESLETRIAVEGLVDTPFQEDVAVGRFLSIPSGQQPAINKLHIRSGRLPMVAQTPEVIVHESFAVAHHLKPGDQLSVTILGQKRTLSVVGIGISPEFIYAISAAAPLPDDRHFGVFWLPQTNLEQMTKMESAFNSVVVKSISSEKDQEEIRSKFDEILEPFGNHGAYRRSKQQSNMFIQDEIAQQRSSAVYMPAIFLAVAAFLIHVISSRLISMQRAQIATLKAIGYRHSEVSWHYVKLIFLMMLMGTLPGLAVGSWLGQLMATTYADFFRFPNLKFTLSGWSVMVGILAGIFPGLLGAWSSIRAAYLLAPAEAMKPLPPPAFHGSLLDRWLLVQRLNIKGKIIIRNLFFRPLRLFLTVLGMSSAIMIVIAAGFWNDTMDFLLETQFQRLQREDLSVSFIHPISSNGIRELSLQDGVIDVEGYRVTPVRLRFLNHTRETAITGWPIDARIRQRLDLDFKKIPLPPGDGVMLSRYFQVQWGLKLGDRVEIEPLDKNVRPMLLPVAGFTDDLLGQSVTMNIDMLWDALKEEPVYNLVAIKADSNKIKRLYIKLKDFPFVAAVNLKTALYYSIKTTMAKIIQVSTLILFGFALAIAVGIIYNSVRVSFSERAWELASMRVMGFERTTVFGLLMYEVTAQVMLCIVPGCLMGAYLSQLSLKLINTETFGFPVIIEPATYARGTLVVLLALIVSALIVQRMAGRLNLVDALKSRE